jgi:hypothetical protein
MSWLTIVATLTERKGRSSVIAAHTEKEHGCGMWLSVYFSSDGFEQRSYDLIRSPGRHVEMWLFNLLDNVHFLFGGQDHEFNSCPMSVSLLVAPDQHAELLTTHGLLEMDQAGLYLFSQLYPHADYAEIHDPDNVFCPRGLGESNDIQGIRSR